MLEMYAPMVNSPITELADAIDVEQTTIEVVDGSKLPDAPNLAMIGLGENTETILYTQKDGNVLSGVTRGFQGVAKAWPQGTRVARFFAAYDQMAIQENIKTLDQSLTAHLNDKLQDGVHGLATTQDLTLYVDATNGDDSNDGLTPQTAFRTIQKAIDSLPQIVNHTVNINTTPGDYGECIISGFIGGGTIFLNGSTTLSSTHRVANLIINRCAITVVVTGFEFVSQTKDGVSAVYAKYVFLDKCKCTGVAEYPGFNFSASRGRVDNCELSNRSYGILSQFTSTVYSNNNSGSENTYGLAALNASTIGKYGTQPSGTIAEYTQSGGVIR